MHRLSDQVERKFINSLCLDNWEIQTDTGWQPITHIHKTIPYVKWIVTLDNGYYLECADTHILFDDSCNEIYAKDLIPLSTRLLTDIGSSLVVSVVCTDEVENMFDITVDSEDHRFYTNGILSHNSTVLDVITFGLFGKAFRNISKTQLVNSINQKNCVVEIEFSVGKSDYKILRGIKPNFFEIHCDGTLINQDAALKDYQKVLEQQILKFNYKTFTQVVILGSASFVPFMQLPAGQRREVIEDILDIKIFSLMNSLLKEDVQKTKDEIKEVEASVNISKEKVASQKKLISVLEDSVKNEKEKVQLEIQDLLDNIKQNNLKIEELSNKVAQSTEVFKSKRMTTLKAIDENKSTLSGLKTKLKHVCEHINFFKSNDVCITCSQELSHSHKETMTQRLTTEGVDYSKQIKVNEDLLRGLENDLISFEALQESIIQTNTEISNLNSYNQNAQERIKKLNESLANYDSSRLESEKHKLKEMAQAGMEAFTRIQELMELKRVQDVSGLLLKDGGIKSTVIKEYLPVFNTLINKYLSMMDFYVNFEIDETFSEKIKSRNRDEFTYSSFSEGEKQKIDLALLFTFRQIAKMKNSLSTNLLLMDEVLDGSLDSNGIEYVINILNELGESDTNIFVISHNTEFTSSEAFTQVIHVEKKSDFSTLRVSSKYTA